MHVVDFVPPRRLRLLGAITLAALGAFAWRAAHRTPARPAPPPIACAIPDVPPPPPPVQRFAQPPPGDPYPRAPQVPDMLHGIDPVEATLVWREPGVPGCGTFEVWGLVTIHPLRGGADLTVRVQCPELLALNHRYLFWLVPDDDHDGKNEVRWRAIDVSRR